MGKENVVPIYNGILAIKKSEIMPSAATWIDPGIVILSEVSYTENDKYMILLICGTILPSSPPSIPSQIEEYRSAPDTVRSWPRKVTLGRQWPVGTPQALTTDL